VAQNPAVPDIARQIAPDEPPQNPVVLEIPLAVLQTFVVEIQDPAHKPFVVVLRLAVLAVVEGFQAITLVDSALLHFDDDLESSRALVGQKNLQRVRLLVFELERLGRVAVVVQRLRGNRTSKAWPLGFR
jgi:hypothetical protein